jgi:hypothetical protein
MAIINEMALIEIIMWRKINRINGSESAMWRINNNQ